MSSPASAPRNGPGGPRERDTHPFQLVKLLSWSFFVLILGTNLVLSIFIADFARRNLLDKQQRFALLLAENLNHQIFQRFTLPTLIGFGRIQLKDEAQFERLDRVVRSTIHSFHVLELRIYDFQQTVAYSTNSSLVGKAGLAGRAVKAGLVEGAHSFEIINHAPSYKALIEPNLEAGTVVLKTVYTLRADRRLEPVGPSGPIMGVLEFTQDITADYSNVINFQRLIILLALISSLGLFLMLVLMIRRADHITAMRASERERMERELHQSEKMASMGRVVSGIAHEIRNPLGIIRSSAELLLRKTPDGDPNKRLLKAMFDESKRLSRTVTDFLDYARPKPPRNDPIDLARILDQVLLFLEPKCAEQGVRTRRNYPDSMPLHGDKDLLYRAFYNLVANALEAMGESGEITLAAHENHEGLHVTCSDTGPGFAPDLLEKVRDPFFTTKDQGTGLGLTIVDTIITGHGARMLLGSAPAGGARVEIVFPHE